MNKKRIVAIFLSIFMLVTVIWAFSEHSVAASSGWTEVIRLTSDDSSSGAPIMAVNGNNIHVVWQDDRDGNYEIYYKRSIDNGENWGSDTRLTTDGSGSWVPVVAVNGNNIHVVWQDDRDGNYEVYYKRSIDNGENWGSDTRLTTDDSGSGGPIMAVNGNNIHVVWQDDRDGNYEVYYKRSTDNGENWGSDTRLTTNSSLSVHLALAVNGNNIHVVWQDDRDGNYEIYYKRSIDNGENWGSDIRLTSDDSSSWNPVVAVNGNNIHVLWQDTRDGNYEIYYKRSIDNGENWGSDTRLTTDNLDSSNPVMAVNENIIHVVWQDDRDGNYEVYYKRSIDNGENWGIDIRLTFDDSSSWVPVVAVNGNIIHVVWQDDRDGNFEIYYKRYYRQTPNQKPTADTLDFSENYVYKGDSITLYANASDDFDNEYDLTPTFEYKFSLDGIWQNTDISYITWDSTRSSWKATFTPSNEIEIGMYDFRVKFTDSDSEESDWINASEQIDVRARPIAVLSASTTNIIIGESITFNASMSTGEELLFYFDFGDGTTVDWGYDAVKTHKYSEEGTYSAQVKVKDVYGKESLWGNIEIAVRISKSDEDSGTPSFEIFLVLCAIALVLLWKRKRMQ